MTATMQPVDRREADRIERDLLARLGLGADANAEEIETAYDTLVAFLETAPHDLRRWAAVERANADEAYALLSDTAALDEIVAAAATAPAVTTPVAPVAAPKPATAATAAPKPAAATVDDDDDLPDELLEGEGAGRPVQRRRAKKAAARAAAATAASAAAAERAGAARAARRRMLTRVGIGIAALAAVAVIAVGGYNMGAPRVPGVSGTAAPEPSAAASGGVDTAQVSALMQRISANPKDTDALLKLGNMYFDAGDYKSAGDFMQKLVDADPTNVDALVGLGAALFNQNQADAARTAWTKAIALNPKSQEAHFDLGFLYLNQDPPDMTQVKAEWNTVIAIDPNSDLAKSVKTHLDAFASASPGTSAAAAAPTAGASSAPVTSPAPSATSGN